ncbi:MAG: 3-isopropylmalate dehydratase large subunit [Reyranella sp.]|uniref:3-isopropylmalate dehydratase large subunit n=1 Tax=Reyranella sp. TaxID=1929291 RepID=UPI0011F6E7AD|nr:3-isopropylmalate dehydratase large subunit [Reyranella sp.]TAJ97361.1 MAG: 3-isopropylmalate dehydratase large subunit [Reyranella sp.]TBR27120.1 MAG: 3-isopropylmalate dehydratase large subunit [Reyranella sp.]
MTAPYPRTLYDKIWDAHVVERLGGRTCVLYVDRHLLDEVHSPQAFDGLRRAGRPVRRPAATLAVVDHNVPTEGRRNGITEPKSRAQVAALEANVASFGVPYIPLLDERQGIVHVIGPELGFSLPGQTIVSGDSHASTHGALGALAFGVGASEVEQVLATQTLVQEKACNMKVEATGGLPFGTSAKDLALAIVGQVGAAGGSGHTIEFCGDTIASLDMAGRMTVSNMAVEMGARAGLIAPDEATFAYVRGRERAPEGGALDHAIQWWRTLPSDAGASWDRVTTIDATQIAPMVTWGTNPETALAITGAAPDPDDELDLQRRTQRRRMLDYMGLIPGQKLAGLKVDAVFIGSCTNGRLEDIRAAASVLRGRRVAPGVRALVVPGSGLVKRQAEEEGLDRVLIDAGFEWRQPGCSMCLAMNPDRLSPGQRCASTSNRNFEGRQGAAARTHLVSPAMASAAAVMGALVDVRELA